MFPNAKYLFITTNNIQSQKQMGIVKFNSSTAYNKDDAFKSYTELS